MKKILVVDDYNEIRSLVIATLENEEYHIFEAQDASEAIQICSQEKPDLIIMDVNMPGNIDGIKAIKLIKGNKETAKCKIIMLSGSQNPDTFKEASEFGADGFMYKPFSPLELIEKVGQALKLPVRKRKS